MRAAQTATALLPSSSTNTAPSAALHSRRRIPNHLKFRKHFDAYSCERMCVCEVSQTRQAQNETDRVSQQGEQGQTQTGYITPIGFKTLGEQATSARLCSISIDSLQHKVAQARFEHEFDRRLSDPCCDLLCQSISKTYTHIPRIQTQTQAQTQTKT